MLFGPLYEINNSPVLHGGQHLATKELLCSISVLVELLEFSVCIGKGKSLAVDHLREKLENMIVKKYLKGANQLLMASFVKYSMK